MVKSLSSFSYSKKFQTLRWNFACHVEQRSCCTKGEVLLTCRWTGFLWLFNIKSLCKVIKYICCFSSNADFSSLVSLGKPQGFFVCLGRLSDLVGLFSLIKACSISLLHTWLSKSKLKTMQHLHLLQVFSYMIFSYLPACLQMSRRSYWKEKKSGMGWRKIINGFFYKAIFPLCLLNAFISDFITESRGV